MPPQLAALGTGSEVAKSMFPTLGRFETAGRSSAVAEPNAGMLVALLRHPYAA